MFRSNRQQLTTVNRQIFVLSVTLSLLTGCQEAVVKNESNSDYVIVASARAFRDDERADELAIKYCNTFSKTAILTKPYVIEHNLFKREYNCIDPVVQAEKEREAAAENQAADKAEALRIEKEERQAIKEAADREKQTRREEAKIRVAEAAEERQARNQVAREDSKTCTSYGLQKGTVAYTDCRIKLRQERENQATADQMMKTQQQQNIEAQQQAADQQRQQAAQAAAQQQQRCLTALAQAQMQPTRTGSPWESLNNGLTAMAAMGCQ